MNTSYNRPHCSRVAQWRNKASLGVVVILSLDGIQAELDMKFLKHYKHSILIVNFLKKSNNYVIGRDICHGPWASSTFLFSLSDCKACVVSQFNDWVAWGE